MSERILLLALLFLALVLLLLRHGLQEYQQRRQRKARFHERAQKKGLNLAAKAYTACSSNPVNPMSLSFRSGNTPLCEVIHKNM